MAGRRRNDGRNIGYAGALGVMTAAGLMLAAGRSKVSLRAMLIGTLARYFAPDLTSSAGLQRELDKDRARGPALVPKRLKKRIAFSDDQSDGYRIFRAGPPAGPTSPVRILYLHGSGYVFDLQAGQWNLISALIDRLGVEVVTPIYPLAPEAGWEQGLACIEHIYRMMADESGDQSIVILGDSAGGGLTLILAQRLRDAGLPVPAALVLISPWLDIGVTGTDQPVLEKRDPALTIAFLRQAGKLWARDLAVDDPRVSPLFGDHSHLPPTILFSGSRDILDSDALRLAAANPEVLHRHYPEMIHVWPIAPIPEARKALDEMADFIRHHIAGIQGKVTPA